MRHSIGVKFARLNDEVQPLFDLPTDTQIRNLCRFAKLLGYVISWATASGTGVIWYATDIRRHVPQRVGSLAELLVFLEALAGRVPTPERRPIYYCHGKPRSPLRRAGWLSKRVDKPSERR